MATNTKIIVAKSTRKFNLTEEQKQTIIINKKDKYNSVLYGKTISLLKNEACFLRLPHKLEGSNNLYYAIEFKNKSKLNHKKIIQNLNTLFKIYFKITHIEVNKNILLIKIHTKSNINKQFKEAGLFLITTILRTLDSEFSDEWKENTVENQITTIHNLIYYFYADTHYGHSINTNLDIIQDNSSEKFTHTLNYFLQTIKRVFGTPEFNLSPPLKGSTFKTNWDNGWGYDGAFALIKALTKEKLND